MGITMPVKIKTFVFYSDSARNDPIYSYAIDHNHVNPLKYLLIYFRVNQGKFDKVYTRYYRLQTDSRLANVFPQENH